MEYECINITILYGNFINMYMIITKGNYCAIESDDFACRSYYIIRFSSYPYTLQSYLNIYSQVISSGEIVCEGNFYFPININSRCCVYPKKQIKYHDCISKDNNQWQR